MLCLKGLRNKMSNMIYLRQISQNHAKVNWTSNWFRKIKFPALTLHCRTKEQKVAPAFQVFQDNLFDLTSNWRRCGTTSLDWEFEIIHFPHQFNFNHALFLGCRYADKHRHCPYWASQGFCKTGHTDYMDQNCQKSCLCVESEWISFHCIFNSLLRWFLHNIRAIMAKIELPKKPLSIVIFWIKVRRSYRDLSSQDDPAKENWT